MKSILNHRAILALALAGLLGACKSRDSAGASSQDSARTANNSGSLEATLNDTLKPDTGMQEMQGPHIEAMMGSAMMDSMQAHMRMMDGVTSQQLKAMLPAHRQMAAKMLPQLDADMRRMNMQPDAAWKALTDSLRQDLIRMPEMNGSELRTAMDAHQARMMRLMKMHQTMMGKMKM